MNAFQIDTVVRSTAIALFTLLAGAASSAHAQQAKPRSEAPIRASAANESLAASGVVNLNTASIEELTRLPGVGPSRAQAIVDLRTRMKAFKNLEDIMRVRGIGRKTFRKLSPMLRLQGPTTLIEARKPGRSATPQAAAR